MDTSFLVSIWRLSAVCAEVNNGFRIRLSSIRGWKKRVRTLCQQFQLSKRFPDSERKYVAQSILWVFLQSLTLRFIVCVSSLMVEEIKRIIKTSEIMKEDDSKWPQKNKDGRQELEIKIGSEVISFETAKIGSLVDVTESQDPEGLRVFYYLVQDLKALVFSLIALHFKIKPI
ncbi:hypothetical protein NHQ30_007047 [Ciborinia camelliae]|nr:hypothetical protein NHQ30_007047 [Ciborinia camelliae]